MSSSEIAVANGEADSCIHNQYAVTTFTPKVNAQAVNYVRVLRGTITRPSL
ncbi:MAG: hypothetical protein ACFE89_12645 [Candidatus Hodarchaeota archaeon]